MTQSQHTPGPWVIGDIRGLSADGIPIKAYNRVYDDYHAILNITTPHTGDAVANAHLIAAAPELLEALESALGVLESEYSHESEDSDYFKQLRSVIAKAKGGIKQ